MITECKNNSGVCLSACLDVNSLVIWQAECLLSEGEKSIVKVSMRLKHIGAWRGIPATGKEIKTIGYRFFRLKENKIIEHWALIDGNTIENQLKGLSQGCKIAK